MAGTVLCAGSEVRKCDLRAGNREVARRGGGECHCDMGIGVWAGVVWRGWNRESAWQGCLMCVLRWSFPLGFWRIVSYEMLVLETWRATLVEVSFETLVLKT